MNTSAPLDSPSSQCEGAPLAVDVERLISRLRLGVVTAATLFIALVEQAPGSILWLAKSALALAWAYAIAALWLEPHRRPDMPAAGYLTSATDMLIVMIWLWATGGLDSPWIVILYVAVAAVSLRNRQKETLVLSLAAGFDFVLMAASLGQLSGRVFEVSLCLGGMSLITAVGTTMSSARQRELSSRLRLLDLTQQVARVGSWEWAVGANAFACSDEMLRILGMPHDAKPTFERYIEAIHPDDRQVTTETIENATRDRQPFRTDHRIATPDGVRWLHCAGRVISDRHGRALEVIASAQDVTERRLMQEQLRFSNKLALVGTLASGLAHEIRHPLACVSNNLDLVGQQIAAQAGSRSASETENLFEAVAEARHSVMRVRDVISSLLGFARKPDRERGPVDVARAVDLAIPLVSQEIMSRARLVRQYERVPPANANESLLSQVFVNLLVNAAQAIATGAPGDNEIRVRVHAGSDQQVHVDIVDSGRGIEPAQLFRIFGPFFTTKPMGVGTGLGLAICRDIVHDLDGEITVESSPGAGSTFRVSLPVARGVATAKTRSAPARRAANCPHGHVLVVDDEPRYATSLRMLLESDHEVTVVSNGKLALERLCDGKRYDVILCDLTMPEMSGVEFHERLALVAPSQQRRVIFLTGGATNERASTFLGRDDVRHLEKPFEWSKLQRLMADVMG